MKILKVEYQDENIARVLVEYKDWSTDIAYMKIEQLKAEQFKQELIDRGIKESDLNKLIDLYKDVWEQDRLDEEYEETC